MNRNVKIILCITAIIIISILFCLNVFAEDTPQSFATEAVMIDPELEILVQSRPSPTPSEEEISWLVTECRCEVSEKFIWDYLLERLDNERLVAAIMGYFWRESGLKSNAIPRWFNTDSYYGGDCSADYTAIIDAGLQDGSTKELFLNKDNTRCGGYGLGQWFQQHYLEELYNLAQRCNTSIGDVQIQLDFMIWSLQHQTPNLWKDFQEHPNYSAFQFGRRIGYFYDGAGEAGVAVIESQANEYYKKYGTGN